MASKTLFLITARGGSKGVPGKNIKLLNGKPLLLYTLEVARHLTADEHICLSTDSLQIKGIAEDYGLVVPFLRPEELANDSAGTYEVILHALNYYREKGRKYEVVVLLQPTSPFRTAEHIIDALKIFTSDIDMVVSVNETHNNPFFNLFEEDEGGYLRKAIETRYVTRQECPEVYSYNGAIYIINATSLLSASLSNFKKVRKYVMPPNASVDIDTMLDWLWAEFLIEKKLV